MEHRPGNVGLSAAPLSGIRTTLENHTLSPRIDTGRNLIEECDDLLGPDLLLYQWIPQSRGEQSVSLWVHP